MWYTVFTIRDNVLVSALHKGYVSLPPSGHYWVMVGTKLVASNHPLWKIRVGRPFDPTTVVKTLKLKTV